MYYSLHTEDARVDGDVEAHLIALRCGDPPEGRNQWTLRLLADKLVELEIVPSICHETVRNEIHRVYSTELLISSRIVIQYGILSVLGCMFRLP